MKKKVERESRRFRFQALNPVPHYLQCSCCPGHRGREGVCARCRGCLAATSLAVNVLCPSYRSMSYFCQKQD